MNFRGASQAIILAVTLMLGTSVQAQTALDLRDADIKSFVQIVAEATGKRFIVDPQIRGTVTVIAPGTMSSDAVYEIFLNVLEINRLTVVEGDEVDRIVPLGIARELSNGGGPRTLDSGYATRVITVENAPLSEIVDVVRPLLPQEAVITAVPGAGVLILSDRAENHKRITSLIAQLDKPREQPIEMVPMNNAKSTEILGVIQSLEITPDGATITADRRSNALLVSGPQEFRQRVRLLVAQLDTPQRTTSSTVVTLSYADANALADVVLRSVGGEAGEISIVADPRSNSLLITAPSERMRNIENLIHTLDRRPSQVLVEAVIFEMSVEGFADLSAQFGAVLGDAVVGGVQFALEGRPTLTSMVSGILNGETVDPGNGGTFGGQRTIGNTTIAGFLSAVASTSSTRLLSTPSIMTLNNQEAEIVVAQNVPFVTGSYSTVGDSALPNTPFQTIERQDVGLTLNVTPQINADKTVRMAIKQEVSNLTNTTSSAGGEITARRALSTTVLVRDGNVIMLGGLLEDGSGSVSQEVPGLSKLPLVGGMFRGKNARKDQRVLLVLLRPRIILNDAQAKQITQQVARDARKASDKIQPPDTGQYPLTSRSSFPYDGADLNQIFDASFIDDLASSRRYPPLPSRLQFRAE
jgi:general secretion pathway protein D